MSAGIEHSGSRLTLSSDSPHRSPPHIPALPIAAAALAAAAAAGRYIAEGRVSIGIAIVLAAGFFLAVFLDIAIAIATWVGVVFIQHLSALSVAPTAIELLILLAWIGTGGARRGRLPVLRTQRRLFLVILLFAAWLTFSTVWSPAPGRSAAEAAVVWESVLVFVVVATSLSSPRDVLLVVIAFVVGSDVSVLLGLAGVGNLSSIAGRLVGGGGDPNAQAAGFLAAAFLGAGLMTIVARRARPWCAAGLILTMAGFFATKSRGGLVALVFAALAAVILLPAYRRQILGAMMAGGVAITVWVSANPNAFTRITDFGGGGSGRTDLWTVAMRIFNQHPVVGSGLNSFQTLEPRFALDPGNLAQVHVVAEAPEVIHNTYLQLLSETGLIGLAAFILLALLTLRASWHAARLFDALGERGFANLARAVLIGEIGMLAAIFFINDSQDPRLWVLFALGPVLFSLARRQGTGRIAALR